MKNTINNKLIDKSFELLSEVADNRKNECKESPNDKILEWNTQNNYGYCTIKIIVKYKNND
jgi:hypothetical protein